MTVIYFLNIFCMYLLLLSSVILFCENERVSRKHSKNYNKPRYSLKLILIHARMFAIDCSNINNHDNLISLHH